MEPPLLRRLPKEKSTDSGQLLNAFLEFVSDRHLSLYPAQEEALLELYAGKNVILSTPTGSGKSLVATALHFKALAEGKRSVYTCPIKALVNEKFLALCGDFGAENVGLATGDATVNRDAPIICCTAEILSNIALRDGPETAFQDIVMDEFHYYSDRERGVAWQVPLLTLPDARFLLMSATLGDTGFFEDALSSLNGLPSCTVSSRERPVPLEFSYQEVHLQHTIEKLIAERRVPVYVVNFTQRAAAEEAQNLTSVDFCTKDEKRAILEALEGVNFSSPYGREIQKLLKHGIGIHHAGLLPRYRLLVERLAQQGLLKIICGTDTLGVGVNIPIRTVLFTKLCKYDGEKTGILHVRDFLQISGRAGRKGFDDRGYVVVQAPEHVIENLRLQEKAAGGKKVVKRKPPEKGYVHWDRQTFDRLISASPEPLVSRFQVTHGMLLNVLSRPAHGCRAMKQLISRCHDSDTAKKSHRRTAFQLFRSLIDRRIIEILPREEQAGGRHVRVNVDLQDDFSLNQTLSLYLLDTIGRLDPESPEYALDLLTLVESILEDPDVVLRQQLDRIKTERLAEMKADGIEYDERMEELEKLEYPKPRRDFIYDTFNEFAAVHPWVGTENIRPKSVAREMIETFQSFDEYVRDYGLQRSEGILLRYLSEVYKTLVQTVPEPVKNEEVRSIEVYLGTLIRDIDSSLLDEWERLRDGVPRDVSAPPTSQPTSVPDERPPLVSVRNDIYRVLRALSNRKIEEALSLSASGSILGTDLEKELQAYFENHTRICTDTRARHPQNTRIDNQEETWLVSQVVTDPDDKNDWILKFELDSRRPFVPGSSLKLLGMSEIE